MVEPEKLDAFLEANPLPQEVTPAPSGLPTMWLVRTRTMRQTIKEMVPDSYGRTLTDKGVIGIAEYILGMLIPFGYVPSGTSVYVFKDSNDQYMVRITGPTTNGSKSFTIIEPLKDFPNDLLLTKLQIFA